MLHHLSCVAHHALFAMENMEIMDYIDQCYVHNLFTIGGLIPSGKTPWAVTEPDCTSSGDKMASHQPDDEMMLVPSVEVTVWFSSSIF